MSCDSEKNSRWTTPTWPCWWLQNCWWVVPWHLDSNRLCLGEDVVRTWSQHMPGASICKDLLLLLNYYHYHHYYYYFIVLNVFFFPGILRDVYWRSLWLFFPSGLHGRNGGFSTKRFPVSGWSTQPWGISSTFTACEVKKYPSLIWCHWIPIWDQLGLMLVNGD